MNIVILSSAETNIAIGISFYEAQNQGLGKYFLDSILSDIESLYIYADEVIVQRDDDKESVVQERLKEKLYLIEA